MPPQLTESWAGTYLQVIATVLVFALGIPALVLRLAVPEYLRRIIHRRGTMAQWGLLMAAVTLVAVSFVWFLHPCSGAPTPLWQHWVAGIAMTGVLVLTILFWWVQLRGHSRDAVIHSLEREAAARTFCHKGTLAERPLADLIYLGEQGEPGYEKAQTLEALDRLAAQVQSVNAYAGDGLEQLVQGIETILVGEEKRGSIRNFQFAARILGHIIVRLQELGLTAAPDMGITLRTLGRLGVAALHLESERAALAFLEPVASSTIGKDGAFRSASQELFKIGTLALEAKRFLIAAAALDKLDTLAQQMEQLSGEVSAGFLGLLAHFWTAGETARRHAQRILSRTEAFFHPSLRECLRSAIEHQIRTTQFDTADKLEIMLAELEDSDAAGD
jgi:hypothetical protein